MSSWLFGNRLTSFDFFEGSIFTNNKVLRKSYKFPKLKKNDKIRKIRDFAR